MTATELRDAHRLRELVEAFGGSDKPTDLVCVGESLALMGRFRGSRLVLRRALVDHGSAEAGWVLSRVYAQQGLLHTGAKLLTRILPQCRGEMRPRALGTLGCIYAALERYQTADRLINDAINAATDVKTSSHALACAAFVRSQAGFFAAAQELAEQAIARDPSHPRGYIERARTYLQQSELELAIRDFETVTRMAPEDVSSLLFYAEALATKESWKEAGDQLVQALTLSPDLEVAAAINWHLAESLYELGDRSGAIEACRKACHPKDKKGIAQRMADRLACNPAEPRIRIDNVPRIRQKGNWCGPCCLAMVLGFWGEKVSQEELAPPTTLAGIYPRELIDKARQRGFAAVASFSNRDTLFGLLDSGIPVITALGSSSWGHFHVVIGYDSAREALIVQETDGERPKTILMDDYWKLWSHSGDWLAAIVPTERADEIAQMPPADPTVVSLLQNFESPESQQGPESAATLAAENRELCLSHRLLARAGLGALLAVRDFPQLDAWIDEVTSRYPDDALLPCLRAESLLSRNDPAGGEAAARHALELQESDWYACTLLARSCAGQNKWFPSLLHARRALAFGARNGRAHSLLGSLLEQRGMSLRALPFFEAAVELSPNDVGSLVMLAQCHMSLGQTTEAEECLQQAEQLAPEEAGVLSLKAHLLMIRNDQESAEKLIRRAIELEIENPKHYLMLGDTLAARGHLDAARAEFEQTVRMDPTDVYALVRLSGVLYQLGREAEGYECLEKILKAQPNDLWTANQLVAELFKRKQAQAKLKELQRKNDAPGLETWERTVFLSLAVNFSGWDQARPWARQWMEEVGGRDDGFWAYKVGVQMDLELGDPANALESARKATRLWPRNPLMKAYYALALGHNGDFEKAVAMLRPVLEETRYDPYLQWEAVLFHCMSGQEGEARVLAERVSQDWGADNRLQKTILALVQGRLRPAIWSTEFFPSLAGRPQSTDRERTMAVAAMTLDKGNLWRRWQANRIWKNLALGSSGFGHLARRRLAQAGAKQE